VVAPHILVDEGRPRVDEGDEKGQVRCELMPLVDASSGRGIARPELWHGLQAEQVKTAIRRIDDARHDHCGKQEIKRVMRCLGDRMQGTRIGGR
jgi:hypothetical protein